MLSPAFAGAAARQALPTIGDAGLVGGGEERVAIENQRPAGIDRQHRRAGDAHRLDRRQADNRHVEAHVLVRLGDLDDGDAVAGQVTGAGDGLVGAFHGLDRDHRLMLHGDGLADVEAGDRVGHAIAELQILALRLGRRALAQLPLRRQQRFEELSRS